MKKQIRLASSLLTVLLLASPAIAADTTSATDATSQKEIALLKAQIAKLASKVDQMQAQSTAQAKTTKAAKATAAAPVAAAAPAPVAAPVAAPAAAPAPVATVNAADVVTKGTFPGSFHVPGTDTSVKIGGYVKLDAIGDINGSPSSAAFAHFANIPLKGSVQQQQGFESTFQAQQSRVNLETRTATSLGELKTFIEGDFFGSQAANSSTNGYGFQIRHAYGSLGSSSSAAGQVLAGQTWSNFMDVTASPESLDYEGVAGRTMVRQAQVRYTKDVGPVTASASIEAALGNNQSNAPAYLTSVGSGATGTTRSSMPDLTARGDYHYASDGYVSLHGLLSQINVDHTLRGNNDTSSSMGYAAGLSGKQTTFGKDAVTYDVTYGRGTGRYIYDIGASSNFYNTTTGQLDEQDFYTANAGYQHYWSSQFRSNLFGGVLRNYNNTDVTNLATTPVNKYVASGHVNLIWQPVTAYQVGLEYMHGYRATQADVEGKLDRVQASFIYGF